MKKYIVVIVALFSFCCQSQAKGSKPSSIIYVDAGKGGTDQGIVSKNGISESYINLAFAKDFRIQAVSENALVVSTRDKDIDVSAQDRASLAQGAKGVLVSFHTSYSEDDNKAGTIIYVANSGSNKETSRLLAEKIKASLKGLSNVEIVERDCYLLKNSAVPSVVIQPGYMSNPEELSKITDIGFVSSFNSRVLDAVAEYAVR